MLKQQVNKNNNNGITTTLAVVVMLVFFMSCRNNKDFVAFEFDPETIPTMITTNVNALISDSGVTRIRVIAETWEMFDMAADPHWLFPDRFLMEEFDSLFNIQSTIRSDTAWNFTNKRLWQLRGNVQMQNIDGDEFETEEIFWNQQEERLYSNRHIVIRRADGTVLRGTGFESNQSMTIYSIRRPDNSLIPVNDEQPIRENDPMDEDIGAIETELQAAEQQAGEQFEQSLREVQQDVTREADR